MVQVHVSPVGCFRVGERKGLGQICLGSTTRTCDLGIHTAFSHIKDPEKICHLETYLAGLKQCFPKLRD